MSQEDRERSRELIRLLAPPSVILGPRAATAPSAARFTSSDKLPAIANAEAALQALTKFFEDRHVMGREEFMRIVRMSQ